jgi:hypothetical protein
MEIIEITGIGMTVGNHILSYDGGAMLAALLLGALAISTGAILSSRTVSAWLGARSVRLPLGLHPVPACGR